MPRKKLERNSFYPYHVFNRTIDKEFYPVDFQAAWDLAMDLLCILTWMYDAKIHSFVLMSNHYHLLISTPSENLDSCVQYFQSNFSLWMHKKTGKAAYAFGTKYNHSLIKEPVHYAMVYRYIYQNPLRAKLVSRVEEYPYSTLQGRYGLAQLKCPLSAHEYDGFLPSIETTELEWLNIKALGSESNKVRIGLQRRTFTPPMRIRDGKRGGTPLST